ncbi:exopolysaccharide Pel transporter PelG [Tumebacillus lipolyticus]|uniref:Exopolysaccharide Pel transporter PelG n=1 Tax=Tumebacillus lipolyticus TaxID=1280370 RepID=A0ABW4ZTN9_9BACL
MAGIGFTLRKALGELGRSGKWRVYSAAAFVAAGPWLLTLISLFLLLAWGNALGLQADQRDLFFATITYAMIGSNLISTTAQFFLTRYLADALYVEAPERLLSGFTGIYLYTGLAALALSTAFQWLLPLPIAYKIWTVVLTVLLTQLGLAMILLSAAKAYWDIARGFLFGLLMLGVSALVYSIYLSVASAQVDETVMLGLFTCGQAVAFLWLGRVIVRDFPGQMPVLYDALPQYRRYPELLGIGFLYAMTLWVDNGIYWFSDQGLIVGGSYLLSPGYDLAKFWTFLAFIPAFTLFSVNIETDFYQVFRRFYDAIESGDTLAPVRMFEEELRTETKAALLRMMKIQAFVASLSWVFAQQVKQFYPNVIDTFQWTIIGSVPHMVWITAFLLLLYFDARKQALWAAGIAVLALLAGGALATELNWSPGAGYLLGSVVMLLAALWLLNKQLDRLLFYAFYDPNGVRKRSLPPAASAHPRQRRLGHPVLDLDEEERFYQEQEEANRWELEMRLPSRREKHGKNKRKEE